MLLAQIWRNLRKRPADAGRTIDIFIDEAHRMPRALIGEILAEARKFGVRLRIATQSPFQLDSGLRDAVLSNSGAIATFRTSPKTAVLCDQLYPRVLAATLARLERHQVAVTYGATDEVAMTDSPIVTADESEAALNNCHHDTQTRLWLADGGVEASR